MSINDVAKLAGVSSSTVSRVMNNHPRVAPETAEAVRKAMKTLGYKPSDRRPGPKPSLRTRTGAAGIAFLVFGTSRNRATPAFEELLHGVSLGASQYDLNLVFAHVPDPSHLPARVLEQRVDGLLLHGAPPGSEVRSKLKKVPTVWLMGNRRRPDWGDQVMPDGYEIGDSAARYLVGRGHKRLAFLNLDQDFWPFKVYGHAFGVGGKDLGAEVVAVEQVRRVEPDYWHAHSPEAVEALVSKFLGVTPRPTGLFVADDMQVAMLQPELQRRGVAIGDGVDVVSCNNEKPYLMGLDPKPAEVDIRAESVGRRGVEQLVWRLEHPGVAERIITTVEPFVIGADGMKVGVGREVEEVRG